MSEWIAPGVLYLTRADWGADPALPRLGEPLVPRNTRIYDLTHHTVVIDSSDQSPNVWEDLEWVKIKMWRLQTIRPDLGLDVPYNFVAFLRPQGELAICEGRGYDRWGAHTAGRDAAGRWYNGAGIATSYQGNFEDYPFDLTAWLPTINRWNGHKQAVFGAQYGTAGPCGRSFCGHRDTGAQTACPGQHLYRRLPEFHFNAPQEDDDMQIIGQFAASIPWQKSYLVFVDKDGNIKRQDVPSAAAYEALVAGGFPTKKLPAIEQLPA